MIFALCAFVFLASVSAISFLLIHRWREESKRREDAARAERFRREAMRERA